MSTNYSIWNVEYLVPDIHRLNLLWARIEFSEFIVEIDPADFWHATTLGQAWGYKSPKVRVKTDPTAAIERVAGALVPKAEELADLVRSREYSPTRLKGAAAWSDLNFIAWDMLLRCHEACVQPPVELLKLLRFSLQIRPREAAEKEEFYDMTRIDASIFAHFYPEHSARRIAKEFGVDVATISRWNRDLIEQYNIKPDSEKFKLLGLSEHGRKFAEALKLTREKFEKMRNFFSSFVPKE